MINIITNNFSRFAGPAKLVQNLIKGLNKIKYPYVINKHINATKRCYIPNKRSALIHLPLVKSKSIVGPNLYRLPAEIPPYYCLTDCIYLVPSNWTLEMWTKLGFNSSLLRTWPVGIDTDTFSPTPKKNPYLRILVYHKKRKPTELFEIRNILKNMKFNYSIIHYGKYKEEDYISQLRNSSLLIWHGMHESQGLALQEALSMDIPILVCDVKSVFDKYEHGFKNIWPEICRNVPVTAAPYFDQRCGVKVNDLQHFKKALQFMLDNLKNFSPREFVLENLSLENQTKKLLELYTYWGMDFESGFSEKLLTRRKYTESTSQRILYYFTYIFIIAAKVRYLLNGRGINKIFP